MQRYGLHGAKKLRFTLLSIRADDAIEHVVMCVEINNCVAAKQKGPLSRIMKIEFSIACY